MSTCVISFLSPPVGAVQCPARHPLRPLRGQSHTPLLPLPLAAPLAQLSAFVSVLLCPTKLGPYSPHPHPQKCQDRTCNSGLTGKSSI